MSTNMALSPKKLTETLARILKAKLVPIVRGAPGVGKSDIARHLAKTHNLLLIDFRLAQADVTDLSGLPFRTEDGKAAFMPFDSFPVEGDELPEGYSGWLLMFDEITSAPKQIQAASYKILLDKQVGNHNLHPKVLMLAAGNRDEDRAVTHPMSTALQSRLIHLELRTSLNDWMEWAADNNIDSRIMAFLQFKPEYLHKFDPEHNDHTYPCPRTWMFLSRLSSGKDVSLDDLPLFAGAISAGPAHEFISFCAIYQDLPKITDVLADPENAVVPVELSTRYAMATHLAEHFDKATTKALVTYINRFPIEFRVICMRLVHARIPALASDTHVLKIWRDLVAYF